MIIDGREIASQMIQKIKEEVSLLRGRRPTLAFILVGGNPASTAYIQMKKKSCERVGIRSKDQVFPDGIGERELLEVIQKLNRDDEVDGILVQLPLPPSISTQKILETVDPAKDVDGFHPINMGRLLLGEENGFIPCTPLGIQILLQKSGNDPGGKHVVILGRSNIVGKPLAALLMQKKIGANATVTLAHSQTKHLIDICQSGDILIAAVGIPAFVTKQMVKKGAVVIDVGINRVNGNIVGDVAFDEVAPLAKGITPVPGGVGPMTIALLLSNTLKSYKLREK